MMCTKFVFVMPIIVSDYATLRIGLSTQCQSVCPHTCTPTFRELRRSCIFLLRPNAEVPFSTFTDVLTQVGRIQCVAVPRSEEVT